MNLRRDAARLGEPVRGERGIERATGGISSERRAASGIKRAGSRRENLDKRPPYLTFFHSHSPAKIKRLLLLVGLVFLSLSGCDDAPTTLSLKEVQALPEEISCQDVDTYITANKVILPRDYDLISVMPRQFARVAVSGLNQTELRALWRAHVMETVPNLNLTESQRRVVSRLLDSPAIVSTNESVLEAFEQQIISALGRYNAYRLFVDLQGTSRPINSADATGPTAARDVPGGSCSCSRRSDWCNISGLTDFSCMGSPCSQQSGCGTLWRHTCNDDCDIL